jgi:hypothetical protein
MRALASPELEERIPHRRSWAPRGKDIASAPPAHGAENPFRSLRPHIDILNQNGSRNFNDAHAIR